MARAWLTSGQLGEGVAASAVPAPAQTGSRDGEGVPRTTFPHAPSLPRRPRTFENVPDGSNASYQRPDEPKMLLIDSFSPGPPLAGLGSAAALTPRHPSIGPLLSSCSLSRSGGWHGRGPESRREAMAGEGVRPLPRPGPGGGGCCCWLKNRGTSGAHGPCDSPSAVTPGLDLPKQKRNVALENSEGFLWVP